MKMLALISQSFGRQMKPTGYDARDLDRDLSRYIARVTSTPMADVIGDEAFLRRIMIDLTGQIPTAEQLAAFVADDDPKKRAAKIDELLDSDAWARKWARYWRTVIFHKSPGMKNQTNPQALEDYLFGKFREGAGWDQIVGELLSADPQRNKDAKPNQNTWNEDTGYNNFVLSSARKPEELASRSARIFMGISIECAECHDHPFDDWKREQFHELAAFFSSGRYYMTDAENPKERELMQPRFLLGEKPPKNMSAAQRRILVAGYLIYNPDNYWFARAYVNRMWSELIGDGFYDVDSLGPDKEVVHQLVVNRVGAQFRAEAFDIRWLFRTICNSETYQREARPLSSQSDLFTSVSPTRLRPWEVADRLIAISHADAKTARNIRREVDRVFEQNPSIPHANLEGTVQQALLLMNSNQVQGAIGKAPWMKTLKAESDNETVVRTAFLTLLARQPTDEERSRYTKLLAGRKRSEAIDDLVWVLMNSAEFVTKT